MQNGLPASIRFFTAAFLLASPSLALHAELLRVVIPAPQAAQTQGFKMGSDRNPEGRRISLNSQTLLRDGKAWMPVMGEFHYSRYPETEWRTELLKMKAGGIDIVATYVFWIHHEEVEGSFVWSGNRNLRRFIELCNEVGLLATVRCGPWCHGEVRNGGIPEWVLKQGLKVRGDDPAYLDKARVLYGQISAQLKGLLWKDGGPVIAIQLENEYGGPAEHLLSLKAIAREAGLDVPLYTRTGWPALKTPMPFGEIAPLFGAYAEGFWDRQLKSMPGTYWSAFRFTGIRTDTAIANEQLGPRSPRDEKDAGLYPYLTCELGGGMMNSYHRRIRIEPADIDSVALLKIGSGGNMPGYYMYHGGTNPQGRLTTLMEQQDSPMTNWNDMPVKGYDFYAPLGEYGQVRPHYHSLRRLHLFARDFGTELAPLPSLLPDLRPKDRDDVSTLRWAVRCDGGTGFVFVSNHERSKTMPAHEGVQFRIELPGGAGVLLPSSPVSIPSGARFIWPFNLDLGHGVKLLHATAQALCTLDEKEVRTVFFAAQDGIPAEFSLATRSRTDPPRVFGTGRGVAAEIAGDTGRVRIVLLSAADSLRLWKGVWRGRERVVLTPAESVIFDGDLLQTEHPASQRPEIRLYPYDDAASASAVPDELFGLIENRAPIPALAVKAKPVQLRKAGPARTVPMGKCVQPVAEAPKDADFAAAAAWSIELPKEALNHGRTLLRIHYRGDAIRVMIGDEFITDDYSNGRPLEIGLWRHRAQLAKGELKVLILPLRSDAPIFIPDDARPKEGAVASLDRAELEVQESSSL